MLLKASGSKPAVDTLLLPLCSSTVNEPGQGDVFQGPLDGAAEIAGDTSPIVEPSPRRGERA